MSYVNLDECEAAGLDEKKVASITRRISKAAKEADEMGLYLFGGGAGYPGSGTLRFRDDPEKGCLIVAVLDGCFDGGDGGSLPDENGLERGEN